MNQREARSLSKIVANCCMSQLHEKKGERPVSFSMSIPSVYGVNPRILLSATVLFPCWPLKMKRLFVKNRTFVLTDNRAPSIFFREFSESHSCCFVHIKKVNDETKTHCPRCQTGELLKVEHDGKSFIGCSNYPKCRYTLNNISILASPKQCPSYGGFLVKRKGARGHWFVGCTNYPYCEHTEQLERE